MTVSLWTLEVDVLLKQNLPSRGKRGIESSMEKTRLEVFFHVHLAKTAGSTVNRFVARRYYGVWGIRVILFTESRRYAERTR